MVLQSGQFQGLLCPSGAFASRNAAQAKRVGDVGNCGPAEQHRLLEHHGLATPDLVIHWRVVPKNDALGWLDESVHQPKQQALSCAIRPQDDCDPSVPHLKVDAVDQPPSASFEREMPKFERQQAPGRRRLRV